MRLHFLAGSMLASLAASESRAATAEARLGIVTTARTPVTVIETSLSVIKTERLLLDEIASRLVLSSAWKLPGDEIAKQLAHRISLTVDRPGEVLLRAVGDDSAKAAVLANTAASVLRDHLDAARVANLEAHVAVAKQKEVADQKRKVLSQIIRAEGIVYGADGEIQVRGETNQAPEDRVRRDASAEKFGNAKDEFEEAQRRLEELTVKALAYERLSIDSIRWATVPAE